jgi:hypothetical protein
MVACMNFWSWLENLLRAFRGFPSVPPVAVPVVPPVNAAPVVSPSLAPVIAPRASPVVAPKPVPKPAPPFVASPKPSFEPLFGRGEFGLTHTHDSARSVNVETLNRVARVQAVFLMGFGAGNPQPQKHGPIKWGEIDWAIERAKGASMPVLIANSAPGWMMESGRDFDMLGRLKREHFEDFANLIQAAVLRYKWLKAVVPWSEWKGFGKSVNGQYRWDHEEFTELYNLIYDKVKAVRPDVRVGGPYMVLDTYRSANQSNPSSTWRGAWGVGDQRVIDSHNYWRTHARGWDFLVIDFGVNHRDGPALFSDARCLDKALDFMKWCRTWTGVPIISIETYLRAGQATKQQTRDLCVQFRLRLRNEIAGESVMMAWDQKAWGETSSDPLFPFWPWLDQELVQAMRPLENELWKGDA